MTDEVASQVGTIDEYVPQGEMGERNAMYQQDVPLSNDRLYAYKSLVKGRVSCMLRERSLPG